MPQLHSLAKINQVLQLAYLSPRPEIRNYTDADNPPSVSL